MTESTSFTQLQDLSATFVRLVETAAADIVAIRSDHARSSGFVWRPGLIVTADEVLTEEGDDFAVTLADGETVKAQRSPSLHGSQSQFPGAARFHSHRKFRLSKTSAPR